MKKETIKDWMIGKRYYRYVEDKLEMLRIARVYSASKISIYNEADGIEVTKIISGKELKENYRCLKSDGIITISIVTNKMCKETSKDIIACMFKSGKMDHPTTVCRQFILDTCAVLSDNSSIVGSCVSYDTLEDRPDDFKVYLACDNVEQYCIINYYTDDKASDILKLVPHKFMLYANEYLRDAKAKLDGKMLGLESSVKDLLKNNNFWSEVDRNFGIYDVPFEVKNNTITEEEYMIIENHIHKVINNLDIIVYGKDIDLDKIKTDYMLVRDATGVVYLFNYVAGSNLFDKDSSMTKEELEKFTKVKK